MHSAPTLSILFLMLFAMGAVAVLVVLFVAVGTTAVFRQIRSLHSRFPITIPEPYDDAEVLTLVASLNEKVRDLAVAIDEGISRVDRSERRVHETVRRAKARASAAGYEDPGLEAEVAELQQRDDGDRGGEAAVRDDAVADTYAAAYLSSPSSIRGVSVEQLRRARGIW